jgi:hypothetical protein
MNGLGMDNCLVEQKTKSLKVQDSKTISSTNHLPSQGSEAVKISSVFDCLLTSGWQRLMSALRVGAAHPGEAFRGNILFSGERQSVLTIVNYYLIPIITDLALGLFGTRGREYRNFLNTTFIQLTL